MGSCKTRFPRYKPTNEVLEKGRFLKINSINPLIKILMTLQVTTLFDIYLNLF